MKDSLQIIVFIYCFFGNYTLWSQQLSLDFNSGVHTSRLKFHHQSKVVVFDNLSWDNYHFIIGVSAPLRKRLNLRSELGLVKTNSFFSINYNYDEGFGQMNVTRLTWLSNQKIYFGILLEYNVIKNDISIDVFSGLLLSSDISNVFTTSFSSLRPVSSPLGLKVGIKANYDINTNIGIGLSASYVKFGQSQLINRYHPKVSYNQLHLEFGLKYYVR